MTMNLKCIGEWDRCLPQPDELTPLSQMLIPHELACAFNILPSSSSSTCTAMTPSADVLNASHSAFKSLLQMRSIRVPSAESEWKNDAETALPLYQGKVDDDSKPQGVMQLGKQGIDFNFRGVHRSQAGAVAEDLTAGRISPSAADEDYPSVSFLPPGIEAGLSQLMSSASYMHNSAYPHISESTGADMSHPKALYGDGAAMARGSILEAENLMQLKVDPGDEIDSAPSTDFFQGSSVTMSSEEQSARTLKKPRLVWTPQLHKRFVDAVAHLGIKHAVPKTIMQLMNVDGLTRENVASHLQKYRLYLKRMQGFSGEGPSASDHLFASTPVPPSLAASAHFLVSHHNQQADHSFGAVQNANLPSVLGHPTQLLTPGMLSSSSPSFPGFNALPSVSTLQRAPSQLPLISSELSFVPQSSSAPGQVLSFFPNSFR